MDRPGLAVAGVMSRDVVTCKPEENTDALLARMREHQIRRVPVVDASGRLEGIASLNDLARAAAIVGGESRTAVAETLARVCQPRAQTGR